MKNITTAFLCFLSVFCFAQTSSIYMKDKTKMIGTVTKISKDVVTVKPAGSSTAIALPAADIDTIKTKNPEGGDSTKIVIELNATDSIAINRIFRLNVFSDLVGLSSEKPNGLIQTEVTANFNLFHDLDSFGTGDGNIPRHFYVFKNIYLGLTVSKIDNKLRTLPLNYMPIDSTNTMRHVHMFDMVQYANLGFAGHLNIFTFETRSRKMIHDDPYIRCRLFADGVLQGYRTTVVDTMLDNDPHYDMFSFGYGAQGKFRVEHYVTGDYKGSRAGLEIIFGWTWMVPVGNRDEINVRYGPVYTVDLKNNNYYNSTISSKHNQMFQPRLTVFYERSNRQRFYFTAALHNNYYKTNRFFQMQVGYSQAIGMKQLGQVFKP